MRQTVAVLVTALAAGCASAPDLSPMKFRRDDDRGSQTMLERDGAACRYDIAQTRGSPVVGYSGRVGVAAPIPRDEESMFIDCMRARGWVPD